MREQLEIKMSNAYVRTLINYIYEEAYCLDIYVEEDDAYEDFLDEMYTLFENNNYQNMFVETMKLYISRCMVVNKHFSLHVLLHNIFYLEGKLGLKRNDLIRVKNTFEQTEKTRVLN